MNDGWIHRDAAGAEACINATQALCNHCGALVDAKTVLRQGQVYLLKWCGTHGASETLISSDQAWYLRSLAYLKPGTEPLCRAVAPDDEQGCPQSCGLCSRHQQHTCVPILEITSACELACPTCLVHDRVHGAMPVAVVRQVVERMLTAEGRINMLTLSGGEPTQHPDLLSIIDVARRPEVGVLSLSTNGVRLAKDDALLDRLIDAGVVISLQLDGLRPDTYARLRGAPHLAELKRRVLERVLERGGRLSLTMTVARGINDGAADDELGAVLELLFSHDQVLSLMLQPEARRDRPTAECNRVHDSVTIPEVVARVAAASNGRLCASDFTPLPCSHPSCFALTYLLRLDDGQFVSLPALIEPDAYIDLVKNQALLNTDADSLLRIKDALYDVWSAGGAVPQRELVLAAIKRVLTEVNRIKGGVRHRELLEVGLKNVKSIFIHAFMDRASFDLSRAIKCCNHYPQADGRLLPACVRNNLGDATYLSGSA
jgi:hypothetical protein